MKRISALLAISLIAGCSGGGGGSGSGTGTASALPPVQAATPTPAPLTVVATPTAPAATPTPGSANTAAAASSILVGAQTMHLTVIIPSLATASVDRAPQSSFLNSGINSMKISTGNTTGTTFNVGSGSQYCTSVSGLRTCSVNVPYSNSSMAILMYTSTDGSGTPVVGSSVTPGSFKVSNTAVPITFSPVVASLAVSLSTQFSAGVAGTATVSVSAATASGAAINLATDNPVDSSGNAVVIHLANSDTSGFTSLSSTTTTGTAKYSYNGNLPLASKISVTATAVTSAGTIASASDSSTLPTASKSFSVSVGTPAIVANTASIDAQDWGNVPDQKIAVVHETNGSYLFDWSFPDVSFGNGPLPQNQTSPAAVVYQKSQAWEQSGVWLLNIFPLTNPFAATDTNDLISIYHAESATTGFYDKVTGVTYSHDGGHTWSQGQLAVTPPGYPTAQSAGYSADCGAMYDPVNQRWVLFFSNGSGIGMAISKDPNATSGTWYKYYNGGFTQPGLGGQESTIASLNASGHTFSSPDVSWNSYLNEWIMTMDGHPGIYVSTSTDLQNWSSPQLVTNGGEFGSSTGVGYSSVIGTNDDKISGATNNLFYAEFLTNQPRVLVQRSLTFKRND